MNKKVIVITGANKGIGYGIAEAFCRSPNIKEKIVILTARDRNLGLHALDTLRKTHPEVKDNVFYHDLDVTHEKSIKGLKTEIVKSFGQMNVLYNNAAIMHRNPPIDRHLRDKEITQIFNTNVWGLINVTKDLLPIIKEGGHIISLSSSLARMTFSRHLIDKFLDEHLTVDDLHNLYKEYREAYINNDLERTGWDDKSHHYGSYAISKVFVNAYTRILDKRLKRKDINIKANAVTPGWVKTDMGGPQAPRSVTRGAETPVWLESFTEERDDTLSGNFYKEKKKISWI